MLPQVYKFIFVSKCGVQGEEQTARRGIAEINQMGNVNPATICYAALQVRRFLPGFHRLQTDHPLTDMGGHQ